MSTIQNFIYLCLNKYQIIQIKHENDGYSKYCCFHGWKINGKSDNKELTIISSLTGFLSLIEIKIVLFY